MTDKRDLIVVGDRVLVHPDKDQDRSSHGLYLPQGVSEKEKIQSGIAVKIGPGIPVIDPQQINSEPWAENNSKKNTPYMPLQAKEGDQVIFLRNAGIEIKYGGINYLILPHSALLLIIRDPIDDAVKKIMKKKQ